MSVTGVVCCGGKDNTGNAVDTGRVSESETGGLTEDGFGPPSQEVGDEATGSPAVWVFKNLRATIEYSEQDKVSSIFGGDLTDAGLVHLKGLTNLHSLDLFKCDNISDAGLIHLKGLTNLQFLELIFCENISDAGLGHLKVLTNLKKLSLEVCKNITDAGLVHLQELTNLQELNLLGCENITDSGVAELRKALPNCEISR